jgi:hypothetical protein
LPYSDWKRIFVLVFVWSGLSFFTACGGSSNEVTPPSGVSVTIDSAPPTIGAGANFQYAAKVTGTSNQNVQWSASAGTMEPTGLYIAPKTVPNPASVTITATSAADASATKSAMITIQQNDPLGTVSSSSQIPSCSGSVQGGSCYSLAVSCPGAADISAYLKVNTPSAAPKGTVLFGVGTGGSGLYDDPNSGGFQFGSNIVESILQAGYNTVQISFGSPFNSNQRNGWLQGPGGVRRLACRYATVADWVYNHPTVINPNAAAANSAPMCATGNSGGSSAIIYALYEYGLTTEFAMVEPTSGPVMSRIDQGCSPCTAGMAGPVCGGNNTHPELCYETADAAIIDEAYRSDSQNSGAGVCTNALNGNPAPNASAQFLSDSILFNGTDGIQIPHTAIKQLLGSDDTSNAVPQAKVWQEQVSPAPASECLPGVEHDLPNSQSGANQIVSDIVASCK